MIAETQLNDVCNYVNTLPSSIAIFPPLVGPPRSRVLGPVHRGRPRRRRRRHLLQAQLGGDPAGGRSGRQRQLPRVRPGVVPLLHLGGAQLEGEAQLRAGEGESEARLILFNNRNCKNDDLTWARRGLGSLFVCREAYFMHTPHKF